MFCQFGGICEHDRGKYLVFAVWAARFLQHIGRLVQSTAVSSIELEWLEQIENLEPKTRMALLVLIDQLLRGAESTVHEGRQAAFDGEVQQTGRVVAVMRKV